MQRNIIQNQIQSLKTHPHIIKLQKINNRLLQLLYYPKDIKSHYAKSQYRIKIELPIKYPEEPPTIKFIDPIQHINISDKNGEVTMPILVQDWSPYISLYIIIDLIDAILVEPQLSPRYCIGTQRLLRQGSMKTMMKSQEKTGNLFNNLNKIEDIPLFNTSGYEEISVIKKASGTQKKQEVVQEELIKPIGTMKKKLKKLKTMILEKSHQFDERQPALSPNLKFNEEIDKIQEEQSLILNEMQELEINQCKKYSKKPALQDNHQDLRRIPILPSNIKQSKQSNNFENVVQPLGAQSKSPSAYKNLSKVRSEHTFQKPTAKKQRDTEEQSIRGLTSTIYLESTTKNLSKINRIIQIFTNELYQLQKKKSQTKNDHFNKIIQKKVQQQISMIEQLQDLSTIVKKSIVSNLKKQLNR